MGSFDPDILSHVYDPAKAHQYYEAHKKLMGRKKGSANNDPNTGPTNKNRASAVGRKATSNLGPEKTKEVRKMVNATKTHLDKLTKDFRSWIDSHPKATAQEKEAQRTAVLAQKNAAIKNLKTEIGKITLAASTKKSSSSTPPTATQGRHH